MGKKLLEVEIDKIITEDNSQGFDTCCRCNGVELHMAMTDLSDNSLLLICDECNSELEEKVKTYSEKAVNDLFRNTHLGFSTKFDGLNSFVGVAKLDTIKKELGVLLIETLKENITKQG